MLHPFLGISILVPLGAGNAFRHSGLCEIVFASKIITVIFRDITILLEIYHLANQRNQTDYYTIYEVLINTWLRS